MGSLTGCAPLMCRLELEQGVHLLLYINERAPPAMPGQPTGTFLGLLAAPLPSPPSPRHRLLDDRGEPKMPRGILKKASAPCAGCSGCFVIRRADLIPGCFLCRRRASGRSWSGRSVRWRLGSCRSASSGRGATTLPPRQKWRRRCSRRRRGLLPGQAR